MRARIRTFALVLVALLSSAWLASAAQKPKLLVAIIVDQFRYDYLLRFRDDYHSGLDRLLKNGAVFTDAHYLHAMTVTAVGHSTFLSGAPPSISGIIGNEWYDRASGRNVTSVFDPTTKLVGGGPEKPGSSPKRLLVSTLSDELKIRDKDVKVIGISIKDRSAILPAGHMADGAYWYDNDSKHWVTSSYYKAELPEWIQKINNENIYQQYAQKSWTPVDSKDPQVKPFCTKIGDPGSQLCRNIETTPWGNEIIEQFAERAIQNENLGGHAGTDVLSVSFSSNDYVGHQVGPDDPAVRDMSLRVDRLIGKLMDFVDRQAGAGNSLLVLSADHGVAPVPEVNQQRNMPGGRISESGVAAKIADALTKRYGPGKWIFPSSAGIYFNQELISKYNAKLADAEELAVEIAGKEEHIARIFTSSELNSGHLQNDPIGRAFSLSFFGPRSPDVMVLAEPYYVFDAGGTGHGTPYDYDTHVPLIFLGPGIKPGTYRQSVAINDVAPTLAAILGVTEPSGSIGRVLGEMLQ